MILSRLSVFLLALLSFVSVLPAQDVELLPIGNFSQIGKEAAKKAWKGAGYAGDNINETQWLSSSDGRVFARLIAFEPGKSHYVCITRHPIQINASWLDLELKAVYRVNEIYPMPASWQNFRFSITWYDDFGNNITKSDGSA